MKVNVSRSHESLQMSRPTSGPPEMIVGTPQVFIQMTLEEMRCIASDLGDLDPARIGTQTKELTRLLKQIS